jgi:hypothetical protein
MNDKERYKIIIKNILEIKNKLYEIEELGLQIDCNLIKKEYDMPASICVKKQHEIVQKAIEELTKETSAYIDINEFTLKYKNIEIWLDSTDYKEKYEYVGAFSSIIKAYKETQGIYENEEED